MKVTAKTAKMEIIGWEAADAVLRGVGRLDAEIAHDQAELAAAIGDMKAKYDEHISPLLDARKAQIKALEAFVKTHKTDLEGKSRVLTFGTVGYRLGRSTITFTWKVARVIEALKLKKLADCLRIKESPIKDRLLLLKDEQLEAVGCARTKGRDRFFAEPDLETIRDKP